MINFKELMITSCGYMYHMKVKILDLLLYHEKIRFIICFHMCCEKIRFMFLIFMSREKKKKIDDLFPYNMSNMFLHNGHFSVVVFLFGTCCIYIL